MPKSHELAQTHSHERDRDTERDRDRLSGSVIGWVKSVALFKP